MGYRSLYAPFAGVVTGRYVDPGALITNVFLTQSQSSLASSSVAHQWGTSVNSLASCWHQQQLYPC